MIDLIAIGDVTEDVFVRVSEAATLHYDQKHHHQHLEFEFPTKLAIDRVDKLIGGNAGNVAIGAARLGLKSALYSEVGKDTQGQRLYEALKENKVLTRYFYRKKGEKTNYSVVLYYKGDRTILVHHEPRKYRFPKLEKARSVYLTSMSKGSERIFRHLLAYLKKTSAILGFNPGTHQLRLGLEILRPVLKKAHVVFLNTEETQQLLKTRKRDFKYLTRKLRETGAEIAVVTDGGNGSYCYDGLRFYHCPTFCVPLQERTGCGDAYATGFMCALLYGQPVTEAMKWGTINSASVIQKIGPQEGLVYLREMKKHLRENPKFETHHLHDVQIKLESYRSKKYRKQRKC